jgi:hypothetical protein
MTIDVLEAAAVDEAEGVDKESHLNGTAEREDH